MKKVLGLDLGTNSIGWAVVSECEKQKVIEAAGSRIIPMDADLQDPPELIPSLIEAWESGKNHPDGAATRLLSLIEQDKNFICDVGFIINHK